ncbi:hypothetical protein [Fluviicola taffensis]|uniref:hypothetical protein n=1 Tax=Fluviicola taffensis TaxID=191579 RepID=UPI00313786F2
MKYTKFSDEDLFESYQTTLDYSGKVNNELILEIERRGGLDQLKKNIELKERFPLEMKRIYKIVVQMRLHGKNLEVIQSEITSDLIPSEELTEIIAKQFNSIEAHEKDLSIHWGIIIRTLVGIVIASLINTLIWFYSIVYSGHMFFILIPGFVLISYGILKLLTGKSSRNVIVYLGTFFSVLVGVIIGTALCR